MSTHFKCPKNKLLGLLIIRILLANDRGVDEDHKLAKTEFQSRLLFIISLLLKNFLTRPETIVSEI